MGKKNKQNITPVIEVFPFPSLICYFLLYFSIALLILFIITPLLSLANLGIVRFFAHLLLGSKTPFIHPTPYFRSLSLSLPVFTGLFLSYVRVTENRLLASRKDIKKAIFCLLGIWLIEPASHILEVSVTKLNMTAFLPNFTLTFLLSISSFAFPFLIWLFVFRPSFLD